MGERPLALAGVQHGTSTADPLVDEAAHYRDQNGDLRGRLARAMRRISELHKDLKESRAHAAELEVALEDAQTQNSALRGLNADLEDQNARLRRKLEETEEDKRRLARESERRLADLEEDMRADMTRLRDDDERRARQAALEAEEAKRRRLEQQLAEDVAARRRLEQEDESTTVFVYGLEGCQKTEAVHKALQHAKVPFQSRDFNKDKRFMSAATKSGFDPSSAIRAPVVCLGDKAWWDDYDENQLIPFPQAVAMDLRRELGLNMPTPAKVREDVDIDTEIYERFLTMQDAFLKLDDNFDGFITEDELVTKCLQWNIPTVEAKRIILEADKDGKGCINFDEFAKRFDKLPGFKTGPTPSLVPSRPATANVGVHRSPGRAFSKAARGAGY